MKRVASRSMRLHGEDRRNALVQAAFRQIAERGFEGLRTRDIAAQAGVNIATLHYYFPSKEALIRGVVAHAMGRFRSTLAPHGSPDHQLSNHLKALRTLLQREPEVRLVMAELAIRSARDPSLARILRDTHDGWHRLLRGLLRRGVAEGGLRRELDSDESASLIIATLTSMMLPPLSTARRDQAFRELDRWISRRP
jgi:AcrR family transcriptional regulator